MKIAIHKSGGFSERWINYCQKNNIDYNDVNRKLSILREESIIFLKNALELPRNTI